MILGFWERRGLPGFLDDKIVLLTWIRLTSLEGEFMGLGAIYGPRD
jgi:hypothetical protein